MGTDLLREQRRPCLRLALIYLGQGRWAVITPCKQRDNSTPGPGAKERQREQSVGMGALSVGRGPLNVAGLL